MTPDALLTWVRGATAERTRAAAALAADYAPQFNAVALLGPGENALSAAFRWLLDERASHGQGGRFRDLFIENVAGGDAADWSGAQAACEVQTRDGLGRIDLLLLSRDGRHCLAIENKPWAGWQDLQLQRYHDDRSGAGGAVRVLALIGGTTDAAAELERHWREDGRRTGDVTTPTPPLPDTVTAGDYRAVVGWLEACAKVARPERVRSFLFDLAGYCEQSILGMSDMGDVNATAATIVAGGPDALAAAREIEAAMTAVYELLTAKVAHEIGGQPVRRTKFWAVSFDRVGVTIGAVLFGSGGFRPWIGVMDGRQVDQLQGTLRWGTPETAWPKWTYVDWVETEAAASLLIALADGDPEAAARHLPAVADALIGSPG